MYEFPPLAVLPNEDLVLHGGDLTKDTILSAYTSGYFPMPLEETFGWYSPQLRGILELEDLLVSRSLAKSYRKYKKTVNTSFKNVITACGDPSRPHGWIDNNIIDAYCELHEEGWAHSIEIWDEENMLVGGLYGIGIDGLFAGESMFHISRDASKVAVCHLVQLLNQLPKRAIIDVQWLTPHLKTLGCTEISRDIYSHKLEEHVKEIRPIKDSDLKAESAIPYTPQG